MKSSHIKNFVAYFKSDKQFSDAARFRYSIIRLNLSTPHVKRTVAEKLYTFEDDDFFPEAGKIQFSRMK